MHTSRIIGTLLAAALVLAGCGGGSETPESIRPADAALTGVANPSTTSGGSLKIGANYDCDSWDPAATYYGSCWTLQRLTTRTLIARDKHGDPDADLTAGQIAPDLASGMGEPNADFTTWTYTLRDGITFAGGDPITSADIKYGFERMWATDVITGGPSGYYLCLLDDCTDDGTPTYRGPYADADGGLDSIETPDPQTIVFQLNTSTPNFDYLVSLPATAPVPRASDTGADYGSKLVSSGPYEIAKYVPNQTVEWERNPDWNPDSDPIRGALLDKITMTILSNADDLDARVKNGTLDFSITGGVQPTLQSQILADAELAGRSDNPVTGFMQILLIYPSAPDLADVHCRRAIAYALDKRDLLVQSGGSYGGTFASTLLPSTIPGHDPAANRYPSGEDWTGDLEKAKEELASCGKPDGFETTMAYSNSGADAQLFASVQAALERVGITIKGSQVDAATYGDVIAAPKTVADRGIGIALQGWAADFPNGEGFLTLLVDPQRIQEQGTTNFASVDDETINTLIDKSKHTSPDEQPAVFTEMDAATMELATYLPYVANKALYLHTARVTNLDLRGGLDGYDVVNLGVSDGK